MKDARGHGSNGGFGRGPGGGTFGVNGIGMASGARFTASSSPAGKLLTPTDRVVRDVRSNLKDGGGIRHAFMNGIRKALGV